MTSDLTTTRRARLREHATTERSYPVTSYVVYRHGSNSNNQSMRLVAPVAIVEAKSADEACALDGDERPTLDSSLWLTHAPWVNFWNNQRASAKPVSRASRADVQEAADATREATRLVPASDCGCQLCGAPPPAARPAYLANGYHCGCRLDRDGRVVRS